MSIWVSLVWKVGFALEWQEVQLFHWGLPYQDLQVFSPRRIASLEKCPPGTCYSYLLVGIWIGINLVVWFGSVTSSKKDLGCSIIHIFMIICLCFNLLILYVWGPRVSNLFHIHQDIHLSLPIRENVQTCGQLEAFYTLFIETLNM